MKKQLTTAIEKKVFTLLVAAVMVFGSAAPVFALPDHPATKKNQAEISYKGLHDKMLVFKVDYKNETSDPYQLIIKNENNEVLYAKKFEGKPLNSDIYLSDVPDNCKLTFSIKSGKKDHSQTFEINTSVKTVEEYIVKGL